MSIENLIQTIIAGVYTATALSTYVLLYTWVYTAIHLSGGNDPVLTLSAWHQIEGPLTPLVLLACTVVYIFRYFQNGAHLPRLINNVLKMRKILLVRAFSPCRPTRSLPKSGTGSDVHAYRLCRGIEPMVLSPPMHWGNRP